MEEKWLEKDIFRQASDPPASEAPQKSQTAWNPHENLEGSDRAKCHAGLEGLGFSLRC